MLLEFHVENFRSLKDKQTLSLVASNDSSLRDSNVTPAASSLLPDTLRSAVIYGANASGKSNILNALNAMRRIVLRSAHVDGGADFPVQPFRLDAESKNKPVSFEISFVLDGVRHQYGFSLSLKNRRVVDEYLYVYKNAKPQKWFSRRWSEQGEVYDFGSEFRGSKKQWRENTRPDVLFLSRVADLNGESLTPVFNWFKDRLRVAKLIFGFESEALFEPTFIKQFSPTFARLLRAADIGVSDVKLVSRKLTLPPEAKKILSKEKIEEFEREEHEVMFFSHRSSSGEADFELEDESDGTINFMGLMGLILPVLRDGGVLVVDELERSLHPMLAEQIIRLFHNSRTNAKGAQLIFTTHNTAFLGDEGLLRRDQVWLVEKGPEQHSELIPLLAYSPRKSEALERGYWSGRYGGVPLLDSFSGLEKAVVAFCSLDKEDGK